MKLTDKQMRFVEEYCVDFNATQAAIRAGYSQKTAHAIGWENLRKPEIEAALNERLDELSMTAAEATKRLTDWGRGSIAPFIGSEGEIDILSAEDHLHLVKKYEVTEREDQGGNITRKIKLELHDAKDAVVQMAKIRGLYTEKMEIAGEGGGALVIRVVRE